MGMQYVNFAIICGANSCFIFSKEWTVLSKHEHDMTLNKRGATGTWYLEDDIKEKYTSFRILMTDLNDNGHWFLCLGGFEVYGQVSVAYTAFEHQFDFDKNGLIYQIGTSFGAKTEWQNPSESGLVSITTHPDPTSDSASKHSIIGRTAVRTILSELAGSYFIVDFKQRKIKPTAYTLRNYISWEIEALKNWDFLGSTDGKDWDIIMSHKDNTTDLKGKGKSFTWKIENCQSFYSQFKVLMTGQNNNSHHMLCVSGFEIYGLCQEESVIYGMASGRISGPRNVLTIQQQIKESLTTYSPSFMQGNTLSVMYRYEPDKDSVEYKIFSFDPLRNFRLTGIRSISGGNSNTAVSSNGNDANTKGQGPGLYVVGQNDKGELGIGTKTHVDNVTKAQWAKDMKIVWCSHGYQWWLRLMDNGKVYFSGFNNEAQGGLGNRDNSIINATLNDWYNTKNIKITLKLFRYYISHHQVHFV